MPTLFRLLFTSDQAYLDGYLKFRTSFCMNVLAFVDLLFHIAYAAYYILFSDSLEIVYIHFIGTAMVLLAYLANRMGYEKVCAYLLTLEVGFFIIIWSTASGLYLGFSYYALAGIIPHFLFTGVSRKERLWLTLFMFICASISMLTPMYIQPFVHYVNPEITIILNYFFILFFLILELEMNSIANQLLEQKNSDDLKKLSQESMQDPLTNLWNRRYLKSIAHSIYDKVSHESVCLAILDIDHFKRINDTHGHSVGDELLLHFARSLSAHFGDHHIIIRHGGEEFLIVLVGLDIQAGQIAMEKFREKISSSPLNTQDQPIYYTFTCGLSQFKRSSRLNEVINEADMKMYFGKNTGRNRIIV